MPCTDREGEIREGPVEVVVLSSGVAGWVKIEVWCSWKLANLVFGASILSRNVILSLALACVSSVSSARFISQPSRLAASSSGHLMAAAPPTSSTSVVRAAVADRTWVIRAVASSRLLCRFPGLAELTVLLVSNLGVASPPLGDHVRQRLALEVQPVLVVQPWHRWQVGVAVHGVHSWHRVK